jgi:hypothetical protein
LLFYFYTSLYDNLWTQYEFEVFYGACDDVSDLSTCSITDETPLGWVLEAASIYADTYYEGLFRVPLDDVPYGDYIITRRDPSQSDSREIIEAKYIRQIGGLRDSSEFDSTLGNSGAATLRFDKDNFFDDIGENCFQIVQDYIIVDFNNPERDINRIVRGQDDYIFFQIELSDPNADVAWQCRSATYCPVQELARLHISTNQKALMLKIDADAETYADRFAALTDSNFDNEPYL